MLRLRKIQWTKIVLVPQKYEIIFHLCNQENNKELMTKIRQKRLRAIEKNPTLYRNSGKNR